MERWNTIEVTPPNKMLTIKDEFGNTGFAQPSFYDFFLVPQPGPKYNCSVIKCDEYWDGGWLVLAVGLSSPIKGKIISWKE